MIPDPLPSKPAADKVRRGRLILIAVAVISAMPLLAALYYRFVSPPTPQAIAGTVLEPTPMAADALVDLEGKPWRDSTQQEHWTVIYASAAACDALCKQTLYLTRQARTAQGKHMNRVLRLWVLTDGDAPSPAVLAEHPDLVVLRAAPSWPQELRDARQFHLVDRRGLLVFRYPADVEPPRYLRELARLVKF